MICTSYLCIALNTHYPPPTLQVLKLAVGDTLELKTGAMAAKDGTSEETDIKDLDFCVFLIYGDKTNGPLTKANATALWEQKESECPVTKIYN